MNFGFFKIRLKNNGCLKIFILRIVGMDAINDQGMTIDRADRSVSFKSIFGSIRAKKGLVKPVILSFGFVE